MAPSLCLLWGIFGIVKSIQFYKNWWSIKIWTLIMAIVWIPAFIAFMLQIFGVIDNNILAKWLWREYMMQRLEDSKNK